MKVISAGQKAVNADVRTALAQRIASKKAGTLHLTHPAPAPSQGPQVAPGVEVYVTPQGAALAQTPQQVALREKTTKAREAAKAAHAAKKAPTPAPTPAAPPTPAPAPALEEMLRAALAQQTAFAVLAEFPGVIAYSFVGSGWQARLNKAVALAQMRGIKYVVEGDYLWLYPSFLGHKARPTPTRASDEE